MLRDRQRITARAAPKQQGAYRTSNVPQEKGAGKHKGRAAASQNPTGQHDVLSHNSFNAFNDDASQVPSERRPGSAPARQVRLSLPKPGPPRTVAPASGFQSVAVTSDGIEPDIALAAMQAMYDEEEFPETARNIMPYETEERAINLPPLISALDQPTLLQWCNPKERKKGYWTLFRGRKSQYHYRIHCAITAWNHDHPDVKGPADLCAAGQLQAHILFEAVERHLESDDGVHYWQALSFYTKHTEWKTVRVSTVLRDECQLIGLVGDLTRRHNTSGITGVRCNSCTFT